MKHILFTALILISAGVSAAEGQIATLMSFESAAARPDSNIQTNNVTSIINAGLEYTAPTNISVHGGFAFKIGETFETAITGGARYYNSAPAFEVLLGTPIWSFIGGGLSFFEDTVYYPEAGFRIATSDSSRLDVYIKILNSSNETYDKHIMVGAGLTF